MIWLGKLIIPLFLFFSKEVDMVQDYIKIKESTFQYAQGISD